MRKEFYYLFLYLCIPLALNAYDLRLSLKSQSEVQSAGGEVSGGVFTQDGWKMTSNSDRIVIPLPQKLDTSNGWYRINVKNVPVTWPHEPCNPDPCTDSDWANNSCYVGLPYGASLIGLGISRDNLWAGQWTETLFLRCDTCMPPHHRGSVKFKMMGVGRVEQPYCELMVWNYADCSAGKIDGTFYARWYSNGDFEASINGNSAGSCNFKGVFKGDQFFVHIGNGNPSDPSVLSDISGAVFSDLEVHFDENGTFCGDKNCDPDENCLTCPQDCGCNSPCYVCNNGVCECNSPHYQCPSCTPSCGQNKTIYNVDVICCSKEDSCPLREFDSYDCERCCEGSECIKEVQKDGEISIDGGEEIYTTEDTALLDTYEDVFEEVIDAHLDSAAEEDTFIVSEDTALYPSDTLQSKDARSSAEEGESSSCSCNLLQ